MYNKPLLGRKWQLNFQGEEAVYSGGVGGETAAVCQLCFVLCW